MRIFPRRGKDEPDGLYEVDEDTSPQDYASDMPDSGVIESSAYVVRYCSRCGRKVWQIGTYAELEDGLVICREDYNLFYGELHAKMMKKSDRQWREYQERYERERRGWF